MQTVKTILEDLSRFSPNARVEPELEIDGVSPVTECCVRTRTEQEAESERERAIEDADNLRGDLHDLQSAIRDAHMDLSGAIDEKDWKRVGEVLEDLENLK